MWFCYNLEIFLTSVVKIEDQIGAWFLQVCRGFCDKCICPAENAIIIKERCQVLTSLLSGVSPI